MKSDFREILVLKEAQECCRLVLNILCMTLYVTWSITVFKSCDTA